jgi:hypothetical protein
MYPDQATEEDKKDKKPQNAKHLKNGRWRNSLS